MRQLLLLTLLAGSALAMAQTPSRPTDANPRGGKNSDVAELERGASEAEQAKAQAELDAARKRLDEAAREVAELSTRLGHDERGRDVLFIDGGGRRRAILGVQIDPASGKEGARVLSVSPGGAAEAAGLLTGDIIVNLDGKSIAGNPDPNRAVVTHMRSVEPEQKVKVKVLRDGKNKDVVVVPRPMLLPNRMFSVAVPGPGEPMGAVMAMPATRAFPGFWHGEFGGMELASITPKLGSYFGATEGVLVVQAPDNAAFKLEDGDVILSIDGRKPDDGAHAMRILRSYRTGEKLTLSVLRQRKALSLAVTLPERPAFHEDFVMPPAPPIPPMPPMPATPPVPGGAGTSE